MDKGLQSTVKDILGFFNTLDVLNIYLLSYSIAAFLLILFYLMRLFSKTFLQHLKCLYLRFLAVPILFRTTRFVEITGLHAILLLVFIGLNIAPLFLGDLSIPQRAAFMALLNLVPTYLGETNQSTSDFAWAVDAFLPSVTSMGRSTSSYACCYSYYFKARAINIS